MLCLSAVLLQVCDPWDGARVTTPVWVREKQMLTLHLMADLGPLRDIGQGSPTYCFVPFLRRLLSSM